MSPLVLRLISSASASTDAGLPPISPISNHNLPVNSNQEIRQKLQSTECVLLFAAGPKDWLKEQKKSLKFLLAPIDASRKALALLYFLGLCCTRKEFLRGFIAFQANTGVEVCTFHLIVKNASSLLDKKNPVKLEADAMLGKGDKVSLSAYIAACFAFRVFVGRIRC
ncbi:putative cytosolic purine 5-nucleotidase [Hibiscus syriacus]|uniref:Cytosolic purine 5-nucleotidase n=1 Tax=Hibiscus syriacus TaxID=106335 RepID=A0A6A3CVB7_HIBSY|nr:putative cytosolic purine 5-nucleotidase [Hibiscus syriacus]